MMFFNSTRVRIGVAALLSLAGAGLAGTWQSELPGGWKLEHLSNGKIEIGFSPMLGGRLLDFRLAGQPFNLFRVERPEVLEYPPEQVSPYHHGLNFGGLRDIHAPDYPGLGFEKTTYAFRMTDAAPGRPATLESWAEASGVRSHRLMTLRENSTILHIAVTLANQRDQYLDLMTRLNGEYNVGPGKHLTIFPNATGGLEKVEYVMGREEGRGMRPSHGDWVTMLDTASRTAMLVRYPSNDVREFLVWTGSGGGEGVLHLWQTLPTNYFGFTGLNIFQIPRETPPGGSVTFWEEHSLMHGLSDVDLVEGRTLMQLAWDGTVYDADETATLRVGAARPEAGDPVPSQIEILDATGRILATTNLIFQCATPGEAEWQTVVVKCPSQDGPVSARLTAFGKNAVKSAVVQSAQLTALRVRRGEIAGAVKALRVKPDTAKQTESAMAESRLAEWDRALDQRDLASLSATLDALSKDVQRWLKE